MLCYQQDAVARGFKVAKFGWGPTGRADAAANRAHFMAAREALGRKTIYVTPVW